ncbi:MAG TPA: head maturation protease, ClpP-related [Arsenophonus nasoniae]|uniref:head maturation protease, ClpP-related n=1 Tax=Arsenophonus nasoniae TaxID=638 RepID=UPI00387A41EF
MKKEQLPAAPEGRPCTSISCEIRPEVLAHWHSGMKADSSDNAITIFDVIGQDYYGEGVSVKRIAAALRTIGDKDVIVNINSPGGDMFEGLAIYNVLRTHPGHVTVNILGLAASAASIIAMAGDDIQMGQSAFLMIHNCWAVAAGNRHDFARYSSDLVPFDKAMEAIYVARSGLDNTTVAKMMDNETYISAEDAITQGFANRLIAKDSLEKDDETPQAALRKIDALLAKAKTPRAVRRKLIKSLTGSKPGAASISPGMPGATDGVNPEYLTELQNVINTFAPVSK